VSGTGSRKKPAEPRKRKKRPGPVSLHPLDFETALKGLLAVSTVTRKKKEEKSKV